MKPKLAAQTTASLFLKWEQSLKLAHEIGMDGVDIAVFASGSHLQPDKILEDPKTSASNVSATLRAHGLQPADVLEIPERASIKMRQTIRMQVHDTNGRNISIES